jgi:hypothetical protein
MPKFIPGLKLSKLFYQKEVKTILDKDFVRLPKKINKGPVDHMINIYTVKSFAACRCLSDQEKLAHGAKVKHFACEKRRMTEVIRLSCTAPQLNN